MEGCDMQKQKLKEIYEYDYIPNDSEIYPLQEWFNTILEKYDD